MTEAERYYARKNADSIYLIPQGLISDELRAFYVARAEGGQDVYAYCSGIVHHWNVWDGEANHGRGERISLGVERGEVKPC